MINYIIPKMVLFTVMTIALSINSFHWVPTALFLGSLWCLFIAYEYEVQDERAKRSNVDGIRMDSTKNWIPSDSSSVRSNTVK